MPNHQTPHQVVLVEPPIPRVVEGNDGQNGPEVVMVHINLDVDQVVRNVQQNNFRGKNSITNVVEQILAYNGLNVGVLHTPNFVAPNITRVENKTKN